MYYGKWKEMFIQDKQIEGYTESQLKFLKSLFTSTEQFENDKDISKDVANFSNSEAFFYFKRLNTKSRARLRNTAFYLSVYHQWCYDKGLIQSTHNAFNKDTINQIVKDIVPDEMLLDAYFTKKDLFEVIELDPDYINRFIMLAIFYGIKGNDLSELLNLKITDLNEEEKTVSLISGRKVPVDDHFIDIMKKAATTEGYIQSTIGNPRNINKTKYVNSEYIIRRCANKADEHDNKPVIPKFINNRLYKFKKEFDANFVSVPGLYKNGLINYISEKYKSQGISFKTALMYKNGGYVYEKETNKYIKDFGSGTTARILRKDYKGIIDNFDEDIVDNTYSHDKIWKNYDDASILTLERKMMDDNFFIIGNDISESWSIKGIDYDTKYSCNLIYRDIKYKAYFYKQSIDNACIRLYRDTKFDIMLYDKFKDYSWRDKPMIRFEMLSDRDYSLSFILPDYLESDIEHEETDDTVIEQSDAGGKEGKIKHYYSKKYERDRINRIEALKIHGTVCQCCDFNFEEVYGDIGIGFIEIHHKKPLFSLNEEVEISPKDDLVPVCPNCHRIIHRKRDIVLTIEEVRELIQVNKVCRAEREP